MIKLALYSVERAKNGDGFEVHGLELVKEMNAMIFEGGEGGMGWDGRDVRLRVLVSVLVLAVIRVV